MTVIVDTFAWVEFLAGRPLARRVQQTLETVDLVVTPDLVLAELARVLDGPGLSARILRDRLGDVGTISRVAPITLDVAAAVPAADRRLRDHAGARGLGFPGIADAVVLATARAYGGSVLTAEPHFEGLPETLWLTE